MKEIKRVAVFFETQVYLRKHHPADCSIKYYTVCAATENARLTL